jgi:hypothetical protein
VREPRALLNGALRILTVDEPRLGGMIHRGFLLVDDLDLQIAGAAFQNGDLAQQLAELAARLIDLIASKPCNAFESACHLSAHPIVGAT